MNPTISAAAIHLRSNKIPTKLLQSSTALFSAYTDASNKPVLPDLPYDYDALERTYMCLFVCVLRLLLFFYRVCLGWYRKEDDLSGAVCWIL